MDYGLTVMAKSVHISRTDFKIFTNYYKVQNNPASLLGW